MLWYFRITLMFLNVKLKIGNRMYSGKQKSGTGKKKLICLVWNDNWKVQDGGKGNRQTPIVLRLDLPGAHVE